MWWHVLEDILLEIIVNHTEESALLYSRISSRVFLQIELKFASDREDLLVEMCVLLSLLIFGPCGGGAKEGKKWNSRSSVKIFWVVPHPSPLVWLIVDSNYYFYLRLENSTVSEKCILNLWGKSEAFSTSTNLSRVFTITCILGHAIFVGFYLSLFFFSLFIMPVGCMVHVHSIEIPSVLSLGHHHQSWRSMIILSFDLLTIQDSRLASPST